MFLQHVCYFTSFLCSLISILYPEVVYYSNISLGFLPATTSKTETQQLKPVMILCGHDTGFCQRTIICSNLKMQMFGGISKWYGVVSFSYLFNSDAKITIDNCILPKGKGTFFSELLHDCSYRNNIL